MGETADFKPPVYGTDGDERFVALPLFFDNISANGLSAEQKRRMVDFKKHILARAVSKIPLKATEKSIIAASISTNTKQDADGSFVIGHDLLQFTEDELRLISNALQK